MPVVADMPGSAPITIPMDVPAIMAMMFESVNAWANPMKIN